MTNFFKFLKWLIWIFLVFGLFALTPLVLNINGPPSPLNAYHYSMKDIATSTIGNLVYALDGRANATLMSDNSGADKFSVGICEL